MRARVGVHARLGLAKTPAISPHGESARVSMHHWGLVHSDIDAYAAIDGVHGDQESAESPPIRAITASQFAKMYAAYAATDVPHSVVFPYLHCSDPRNIAQNLFFGAGTRGANVPLYRGLTIVRVSDKAADCALISSVDPAELLDGSSFLRAPSPPGISLRNFAAQCIAYAQISDIVVYAPSGPTAAVLDTARRFRSAQQRLHSERIRRGVGGLTYNVFVISEPFSALERECPDLIAVNSAGADVKHIDFAERERFELNSVSRVSEVMPGFWLGPTQTDDSPFSIIMRATEDAELVPESYMIEIANRFAASDTGRIQHTPRVHIDVPCGLGDFEPLNLAELAAYIVDICAWVFLLTHPDGPATVPRRALVHCFDGCTESSVIALAYLMYASSMSLSEAYVDLQLRANRSFFVYPRDVILLQAIETHISLMHAPGEQLSSIRRRPPAAWLVNQEFDGCFPSRILPFLYLGSLTHAANAPMLECLGITHVVSVGESALSLSPELAESCAAGQTHVLELNNVMDDGIDSLRSVMCICVEFIEAARKAGTHVLVHCRVGVSRSSTIALAYVMAHLDLNLAESYLLVRSRRLNILIQPNLLFFWELRGWESFLARQRSGAEKTLKVDIGAGRSVDDISLAHLQPPPGTRLTWGYLCREIAALNARYAI